MNGIIIDPEAREIYPVSLLTPHDYKVVARIIGARIITPGAVFDNEDTIYCDDESLLAEDRPIHVFTVRLGDEDYHLNSKALVLGTTEDGDFASPQSTINEIKDRIKFLGPKLCTIVPFEEWQGQTYVIGSKAEFRDIPGA